MQAQSLSKSYLSANTDLQGFFEVQTNMKRVAVLSALVFATLSAFTLGSRTDALAQTKQANAAHSTLPDSVKRAAIATRSSSGMIAGARIGRTNHFVVYIKTPSGCGSGGCRAQIWELNGHHAIRKEPIAVGHLPIVALPEVDNGMPRIGVSTITHAGARILPIAYDGQNYSVAMQDNLLPPKAGRPLITTSMLEAYR